MANWKTFKIERKQVGDDKSWVAFDLDGFVTYKDIDETQHPTINKDAIYCCNSRPFNSWQEGDYIEINLDRTCCYIPSRSFYETDIVRKISSSEITRRDNSVVIPSVNQNQVNTIIGQINSAINTDERNEYEAKIHVDPNSGKYSGFSIIGRRK